MRWGWLALFLALLPLSSSGDWWTTTSVGGGLTAYEPTGAGPHEIPGGCRGVVVSNASAGANATFGLCDARAGMDVTIIVQDGAVDVNVEPKTTNDDGTDDRIMAPDTAATGNGLTWDCTPTTCVQGSLVRLVSNASNEWMVMQIRGQAPVDNGNGTGGGW